MDEIPDCTIHLIVTSPPYNTEIEYSTYVDKMPYIAFVKFTLAWIMECVRVLVPGGRICINIANTGRKPYLNLNTLIVNACLACGLIPIQEFVWNKGRAIAAAKTSWGSWRDAKNPYPRDHHEFIEAFYKPIWDPYAFDGYDRIKKPVYKLDCTGYEKSQWLTGHRFSLDTFSVWDEKPERNRSHPAPFPINIPLRCIEFFTRPGMWVLDPFGGWGTTGVACCLLPERRHFILYEIDPHYCELARKRINGVNFAKLTDFLPRSSKIQNISLENYAKA